MRVLRQLEQRVLGAILDRLYPELSHLPDPDDRWRAITLISMTAPPWYRRLMLLWIFVILPIGIPSVLVAAFFFLQYLRTPSPWLEILMVGIGCIAAAIGGFLWMWFFSRLDMKRCRELVHNIGVAICPQCGYSLLGHFDMLDAHCPECGAAVEIRGPTP